MRFIDVVDEWPKISARAIIVVTVLYVATGIHSDPSPPTDEE
jgi:hypothetical protein